MAIECHVYDATNTTKLGELPLSFAREWRDDLMDIGYGSVSVPVGTDDDQLLRPDRVVRFYVDGEFRFAFICSEAEYVIADAQEEATQIVTWTGPGLLQWLDEAVVLPERGLGRRGPATRAFNFGSIHYDDSGWGNATQIKQQRDPDPWLWHDMPDFWRDEFAWWIWSRPIIGDLHPVGTSYFRRTFTVSQDMDVLLNITADNGFEVYLDGEIIAEEGISTLKPVPAYTYEYPVRLDAGQHVIAVKAANVYHGFVIWNVAGLLVSILKIGDDGQWVDPDAIVRSDSSWKTLDYPSTAPTMTPGEIMRLLVQENQATAIGALGHLTLGFTDTHDSKGNPWNGGVDMSVPVGSSLLDTLRALAETSIDFRLDHATNTLLLYNRGTMDAASGITLSVPGDVASYRVGIERAIAKRALVQSDDEVWYGVSSGQPGRRSWRYARIGGATSVHQISRVMNGWFSEHGRDRADFVAEFVPGRAGMVPYADFVVGDMMDVPDFWGFIREAQVTAISVSEPPPGVDGEVGGTTLWVVEGRIVEEELPVT